jgi:hypothetical protein
MVSSIKEAGHGRYDICIHLTQFKRVIIIKFKKSKSEKIMAADAKAAVVQV